MTTLRDCQTPTRSFPRKLATVHLFRFRAQIVRVLFLVASIVAINVIIPLTNKELVDTGILFDDYTMIIVIIVVQGLLYLGLIGIDTVKTFLATDLSSRVTGGMIWAFFDHLLHLPMDYFAKTNSGEVVERIRDLQKVQTFIAVDTMEASGALLTLIALAPLLAWINLDIFIVFALSAVSYLTWIIFGFRRKRKRYDDLRFTTEAESRAIEINILRGIEDIKLAKRERHSLALWEKVQAEALSIRFATEWLDNWQTTGGRFISRTGLIVIAYLSAVATVQGRISLGEMTVTAVIAVQLFWQVDHLLNFSRKQLEVSRAMSRVAQIQDMAREDVLSSHYMEPVGGDIKISDLTFNYDRYRSNPILQNVSLRIQRGATIAIVGPSGSGKSTLLKLLLKLLTPSEGAIFVGDNDLRQTASSAWFDVCAAVMQDGAIFDDTIAGNIAGAGECDPAWLEEVLDLACCRAVVESQQHGLATRLGLGGVGLSMGEKQRILIARAIYKRPDYLFLDEATSALDRRSEATIARNIAESLPGVTKLIIAHRLETVRDADWIVVLDEGRVLEQGTHHALLKAEGLYAELLLSGR